MVNQIKRVMKKLSIEEKAKRYDEALVRANEMIKDMTNIGGVAKVDDIQYIFPELKDSEDERIRKELLAFCKNRAEKYSNDPKYKNISAWIAWIEKQGEGIIPLEEIILNVWELGNYWKELTKGVCNTEHGRQLDYIVKHWKEGEHYIKSFEKQGEKPDDKVEPKFHKGDWISGYYTNYKVTAINSNGYAVEDVDGNKINILFENEKFHHLWTIQDAKDGDVLHSTGWHNDCIFIFNGLDNWKFDEPNGDRAVATGYCCLSVSADKMEFGIQGPDCIEANTIKPATKIQRDLLFQKMHEAGYKWNADTLTLEKIEKPSTIKFDEPDIDEMVDGFKKDIHYDEIIKTSYELVAKREVNIYRRGLEDMWNKIRK